ncbi:Scr1 family TA system antitoxin-like transcriptional regulator [Micromonospora trifolii]|uniref:Scr1 family TA system antitoxin-like transcriptional regulator n=1 Tax=Micromonospora trifolii TaxID=2911208 RepID=UPI003D2EBE87
MGVNCSSCWPWKARSYSPTTIASSNRVEPEPSVVYHESLTGALYLDRPAELAAYEEIWASLDALALDPDQYRRFIEKILVEVHHG